MKKGKTFIICGPSGVGKGTVIAKLLENDPTIYFSVSATTRPPRPGEIDAVHYHFLTVEQFQQWVTEDAFLEYAAYGGNCYGTPKRYVDAAMEQGRDVLLDIDVQGSKQIQAKRPEVIRIFIAPPSMVELERRLTGRGTESREKIAIRLARAQEELRLADAFDYLVINDALPQAVEDMEAILRAERCRPAGRLACIRQ